MGLIGAVVVDGVDGFGISDGLMGVRGGGGGSRW